MRHSYRGNFFVAAEGRAVFSVDLPVACPHTGVLSEKESRLGNIGLSAVVSLLLFQLTAAQP
jgi:hypothetical protein